LKDERGATPLHRAASQGNTNKTQLRQAAPSAQQSNGFELSRFAGQHPTVSRLPCTLALNGPMNSVNVKCWSARHLACEEDCSEEAKLLVSAGASVEVMNKEEATPIMLASKGLAVVLQRLCDTLPH
jgi:ankyrin repeat protein